MGAESARVAGGRGPRGGKDTKLVWVVAWMSDDVISKRRAEVAVVMVGGGRRRRTDRKKTDDPKSPLPVFLTCGPCGLSVLSDGLKGFCPT